MAEESLGDIAPRKGPGLGTWLIVILIVGAIIGGVMLFTGDKGDNSSSNANPTTPVTTITQLKNSVDSLSNKVGNISKRLSLVESTTATMTAPTVTKADINALQSSINSLVVDLNALEATVANLTGEGGGNGTEYVGDVSRWDFDSLRVLDCTGNYDFEVVDKDPSRIEEEDLYELVVAIANENDVMIGKPNGTEPSESDIANATIALNNKLEIVLSPRDYCVVDEDLTYLDSDGYPYLSWDSDFVTRTREGQEVCRRITFTSEKHNFGDLLPGESIELDLVFELYYA